MALERLGPVALAPGITRGNALSLVTTMFFLGITVPFINFAQPFILTEHLGIPKESQGVISGDLAFWTEVVLISLSGVMGAWSDQAGRRLVFTAGLVLVAVSYVLYPLAGTYAQLLAFRLVYAFGMAAVGAMSVAVQAEYPADGARGKLVGVIAVLSIIGVLVVVAALAPLPARFMAAGANAVQAGRYTYWITAGIGAVAVFVAWCGLARRTAAPAASGSMLARFVAGWRAARRNPRIALAYGAAFVARTDLVVVVVFLSLWVTQEGRARGLTTQAALVEAGVVYGVLQGAALLFAPVMGVITDRVNRVMALVAATGLAMAGYVWMGLLDSPMGTSAYPAAVVLGAGQVAAIMAATALVGQEAGSSNVGAVSGMFTLVGAVGILLATKVGGWLFDAWMPGGPFVITGMLNGMVLLAALSLIATGRHRSAAG